MTPRLTYEQRQLVREMVSAKRRDLLHRQEARLRRNPGPRSTYWRDYYAENKTRILALRKARREA